MSTLSRRAPLARAFRPWASRYRNDRIEVSPFADDESAKALGRPYRIPRGRVLSDRVSLLRGIRYAILFSISVWLVLASALVWFL